MHKEEFADTTTVNQPKVARRARSGWKVLARSVALLAAAALVGLFLRYLSRDLQQTHRPAGFALGLVQGALMPCALPNLLVGNDVPIYAQYNTGLTYKLGYTCGVDVCGAVFFGIFFWRISRWRRRLKGTGRVVRKTGSESQ